MYNVIGTKAGMMDRQSKEKALDTRLSILDAAERVFDEKGVAASTLEGIAAAAHVTRGAIYWHFEDKQALLKAMLERRVSPLIAQFKDGLQAVGQVDIESLLRQTETVLRQLLLSPESVRVSRILLLKCEYLSEAHPITNEQKRLFLGITQVLEAYFKRLKQHACWPQHERGVSPALAAKAYQCYVLGLLVQYLKMPEQINLQRQLGPYLRSYFLFSLPQPERGRRSP